MVVTYEEQRLQHLGEEEGRHQRLVAELDVLSAIF